MPSCMKTFWMGICAAAIMAAVTAEPAAAHYLWVIQEADGFIVARGTPPDELEGYDPAALRFIDVFDAAGSPAAVTRDDEKERSRFHATKPISLAAIGCYWGHRVNTTRGKLLMTRRQAEQQGFRVLKAFDSTQTSKTLFADGAAICRPVGMKMELVPMKSPFTRRAGEPLIVQLFFDGAALQNTVVNTQDQRQATTDDQGIARFDVDKPGWHVIWARHDVSAPDDADVDYHQFMTFLVFEVPR